MSPPPKNLVCGCPAPQPGGGGLSKLDPSPPGSLLTLLEAELPAVWLGGACGWGQGDSSPSRAAKLKAVEPLRNTEASSLVFPKLSTGKERQASLALPWKCSRDALQGILPLYPWPVGQAGRAARPRGSSCVLEQNGTYLSSCAMAAICSTRSWCAARSLSKASCFRSRARTSVREADS